MRFSSWIRRFEGGVERGGDRRSLDGVETAKMRDEMTNGSPAEDGSTKEAFKSMKKMSPDTEEASERYQKSDKFIEETNTIYEARQHVKKFTRQTTTPSEQQSARKSTPNHQSPPHLTAPSKSPPCKISLYLTYAATSIASPCFSVCSTHSAISTPSRSPPSQQSFRPLDRQHARRQLQRRCFSRLRNRLPKTTHLILAFRRQLRCRTRRHHGHCLRPIHPNL